jgi:hypothetical protein
MAHPRAQKTPDGTSEQPSQPVVLDPNWEKAPWANLPHTDQPGGWTERGKPVLIVLPIAPKSASEVLGPWLNCQCEGLEVFKSEHPVGNSRFDMPSCLGMSGNAWHLLIL